MASPEITPNTVQGIDRRTHAAQQPSSGGKMKPKLFASNRSCVVGDTVSEGINAIARRKLTLPVTAPANKIVTRPTVRGVTDGTNSNVAGGGAYGFASSVNFVFDVLWIVSANGRDNRVAGVEFPLPTARSATSVDRIVPSSSWAARGDVAAGINHTLELSVQANRAHRPALLCARNRSTAKTRRTQTPVGSAMLRVLCALCGSIDRATFCEVDRERRIRGAGSEV